MQGYSIYQHSSVCHTFRILPSRVTSWSYLRIRLAVALILHGHRMVLRQVHLASQSFLTLYGPGIFYSTHAARAYASAAARMHSSCFHDNDATSTRVCTRVYTAVDLVYSSTCSTRSKFSTSLDHNKWICGFIECMYTWVQCPTHTNPQIYLLWLY